MTLRTRSALRRLPARHGSGVAVGALLVVTFAFSAFAFWTTTGGGTSSAATATLGAPTGVTASAVVNDVTVGFTGVTPPGSTLDGYYVTRYAGVVPSNACGTNPAVPATFLGAAATSCVDATVPNGTYTYRVTAVFRTWTAQSAASAPVIISVETTPPTQVLTVNSSGGTYQSGGTLYVGTQAAGSFTLSSAVTDSGTGPASATFPALATAGWTHAAETVTSGTGSPPTITYTSSPLSWTAGAASPGTYTVTAADVAGNTSGSSLNLVADPTGPTGGLLTVNGTVATSGGAVGHDTNGTFAGTRVNYNADTGSGFLSSVLTREVGTLANGACSGYAAPTTLAGNPNETTVAAGCYRYTLTGSDRTGNTSVLSVEIRVDGDDPSQVFSATGNGAVTGTTLYYRRAQAGSFVLTSSVTDVLSGPAQVTFPNVTAAGWTHPADTVTTGVGADPTIAYSSTYSWTANPNNPNAASRRPIAADNAGNTDTVTLTFTADNTAPTGGALVVNGTAATVGGSTSSSAGTFGGTRTDYTDAAAGMGTSTLTREFATFTSGACGTYGAPTVVVGAPSESGLATGCYRYTLTGTDRVGNVAPPISTVVRVDGDAPTQVVTMNGGATNALLAGTVVRYRPTAAGSFTLSAAVTDTGSGPASATFPAIATAGWTHAAETVATGSGSAPTITYPSSAFSWTAGAANPADRTVTGADAAGGTVGTTLSFAPDSTGPTGGALDVNGTPGTGGGATSYSTTGTYAGTFTHFDADAGAGLASSILTRATTGTLTNGACGAFGAAAPIASISETNAAAGCYRYTLTGTDLLGNTSTLIVVVQVDKTAPTIALSSGGPNGYLTGSTLYYRGNQAGTFTLAATVNDGASGPASATFPNIATAGWTHAAQTVTTGTGSAPAITYTSSTYSWTASPTNPTGAGRTITGADLAGNTVTSTPTFVSDTTAPTGGALTVNGVAATAGGSTSNTNATSWTIGTRTDYNADTGSGFASSVLTRESAPWSGTTCGTFGAPTVITGSPAQNGMAGGMCHRYTLTGTDNVGNTLTLTTTVRTGVVVTSVTLANGGAGSTSGTLNRGDTITVQFSGPLAVSSMCSTWSGDTTDQVINGDGIVDVTIREGAGAANDYVQVGTTTAACGGAFNFGTITLGNDGYLAVTSIQRFRGSGGTNRSIIAYDADTYTLTITLGINETTPGIDGSNNVPQNTVATFAPDTGLTGVGGVGITGVGTTANVRQF